MSARYMERLAQIEKVLLIENKKIDMVELRHGCLFGIPDPLRPLGWRLLLNYLPPDREHWKEFLRIQRENYDSLVHQLIVQPGSVAPKDDHPLAEGEDSEWGAFFEDNQILTQIDKDVRRLCPEIQFFQLKTKYPHPSAAELNLSERVSGTDLEVDEFDITSAPAKIKQKKRASEKYRRVTEKGEEVHWQVVERILFIYAKLNPGVKYVQGMNEVLGPIYYALASDPDTEWASHAEADSFFCFQQLMSEIKDVFIKTLDNSNCGIESSMSSFHDLLEWFDPELHQHLVVKRGVLPQFYAFRWLSLLLSQEFPLPDVITLWDTLFADPNRFSLLPYICLSMLELQREELLAGEFADILKIVQNYPDTDIIKLVTLAISIKDGSQARRNSKAEKSKFARHKRTFSDKIREIGSIFK